MCSQNHQDIPIRSLLVASQDRWKAICLDFALESEGGEAEEALDRLDEAITAHLEKARAGKTKLFRSAAQSWWDLYFQAAEARLLATGPGHGHVENRPLVATLELTPQP